MAGLSARLHVVMLLLLLTVSPGRRTGTSTSTCTSAAPPYIVCSVLSTLTGDRFL